MYNISEVEIVLNKNYDSAILYYRNSALLVSIISQYKYVYLKINENVEDMTTNELIKYIIGYCDKMGIERRW